jgi:TolA-binding protein
MGEAGSEKAAIGAEVIRQPKSKNEVEKEVLSSASITPDVLGIITSKVENNILRSSGSSSQTIIQLVESKLAGHNDEVQTWLTKQNGRLSSMESTLTDNNQSQIRKLEEKIASLEGKIEAMTGALTLHGAEESRMIHEAYKIITERRSTDDGSTSEPSILQRMETRDLALQDHLRKLEPTADSAIAAVKSTAQRRQHIVKKFGRMM